MRKLEGKVALITGGSRGIGRAIAETYAREGAKIVMNYLSNKAAADAAADAIKAAGGEVAILQADTLDSAAVRRLFDEGEKIFGGLDIVVANSHPGLPGIAEGAPTQLSDEAIDHQLKVLRGFIVAFQEAGRRVRDNGVIISLSSGTTRLAVPAHCLYSSTKLAIEQLTRALSREVAIRGVRAVTLAPGLTRTDRIAGLAVGPTGSAPAPAIPTPFTRPGEVEEVADAALFLASDDARWVNTTTLYVNGGAVYAQ